MKNVQDKNSVAVWMDHEKAEIINPDKPKPVVRIVHSAKDRKIPGEVPDVTNLGNHHFTNHEFTKHHREDNITRKFYRDIAETIKTYSTILIFGPTTAHNEFYNYLLKEKSFAGKRLTTRREDYLTENQIVAFVKENLHPHHTPST